LAKVEKEARKIPQKRKKIEKEETTMETWWVSRFFGDVVSWKKRQSEPRCMQMAEAEKGARS